MVDDEFRTYLLEINSSPAMDYSTVSDFLNKLTFLADHRAVG